MRNKELHREYMRDWSARPANKERRAARKRELRAANLEAERERERRYRASVKAAALAAYGGSCSCCGEAGIAFLTIDHVDGGGNAHREEVGKGFQFYSWLRREGYPPGYTTLCFNCNCGRAVNGGVCPHQSGAAL